MAQDQFPVAGGGEGDGASIPVPRDGVGGTLALRQGGHALDLFEEQKQDDEDVDLLAYWQILMKRRWLVLGLLACALAMALLVTLLTPPVYRATATVQIDREAMQIVLMEGVTTEAAAGGDFYETQFQLLKSRALAERVADSLHLAGSPQLQTIRGHS